MSSATSGWGQVRSVVMGGPNSRGMGDLRCALVGHGNVDLDVDVGVDEQALVPIEFDHVQVHIHV